MRQVVIPSIAFGFLVGLSIQWTWWTLWTIDAAPPKKGAVVGMTLIPGFELLRTSFMECRPFFEKRFFVPAGRNASDMRQISRDHEMYYLRFDAQGGDPSLRVSTTVFIHGAAWRTQTLTLCSALGLNPDDELRLFPCSMPREIYAATVHVFLPAHRPQLHVDPEGRSARMRQLSSYREKYMYAKELLQGVTLCVTLSCPEHLRVKLLSAMRTQPFVENVPGETKNNWEPMGISFIIAALTLPQPFTIVEIGNLCGQSTVLFAALKKTFCSQCRFHSADPGFSRITKSKNLSCALHSVTFAGLKDEVSFVDDTPDVISIDLPIGFIYFDGGKLRQFNLGFHSMIREKIMNGALLVFDDTYGAEPGHHNRWGQIMTVDELVNTGEYRPVFIPPHAKSKTRLLRGANSSEIPHHIEVRFQSLEKHAEPIDESMRLGKTSTVVKVKGWETADLSEPSADQVRLDVMSSKGKVRVSSWVKLCVVSKPAPIEILTPRQILQHERNVNVVSGKKDIQRERERPKP